MQVNKTKFERNSSLEYYHMTCLWKTKQAKEVYFISFAVAPTSAQ